MGTGGADSDQRRVHTSPSPSRTRMRWSLVLVCVLLLLAVSEGKKKKPSKGKKPGKKPSKPGVKGECDVGSPKLTAGNTKKYTEQPLRWHSFILTNHLQALIFGACLKRKMFQNLFFSIHAKEQIDFLKRF